MSEPRVVVISGGSRGLGGALARDLLARGWTVATFSRKPSPLVEELQRDEVGGRRFYWQELDSNAHPKVQDFALGVARRFGRIDALVNNAAMVLQGLLTLSSPEDIHRTISLNVESTILLTRACCRVMLSQRSGSIVNVSSLNAVAGHAGVAVYSAAKAALDGFTRSLAREVGPRGIRVNSVAPGYFDSEMASSVLDDDDRARIVRRTPLRRLGTTADVVPTIRFLLSADAGFVTGHTLVVDGGVTC